LLHKLLEVFHDHFSLEWRHCGEKLWEWIAEEEGLRVLGWWLTASLQQYRNSELMHARIKELLLRRKVMNDSIIPEAVPLRAGAAWARLFWICKKSGKGEIRDLVSFFLPFSSDIAHNRGGLLWQESIIK
jgi:hypothetical protein